MPWLSRVQQSHDRDEDRGREKKEHKKPCANQPTLGDLAALPVHLQVTMIIADLGRRWMWAHARFVTGAKMEGGLVSPKMGLQLDRLDS